MIYMLTHSGARFDLENPSPDQIFDEDIAIALSRQCRFNGHSRSFYSVAQHSCYVADELRRSGEDADVQFAGLMHDAAEAYVGDVIQPIKSMLSGYADLERRVMGAIAEVYELPGDAETMAKVKRADMRVLFAEKRDLMMSDRPWPGEAEIGASTIRIVPHETPDMARAEFVRRLRER